MKPQMMDEMKRIYLKTLMDTATAEEQNSLSPYLKANPEAEGQLKNYAKQELARVKDYDAFTAKQDMPFVSSGESKVRSIFSWKKMVAAAAILLLIPLSWLIFRQYTADDWIQYA
ncbi:MAG: hypothetical protein IPN29_07345 [Saprospiraceae bacterium]|nr:hypothetical protein [Saprospiraceae bacterium]